MKKELQRILRREFDSVHSRVLAKETINMAKMIQFDGEPLDPAFIKQMEDDLK